ncbi:MAG: Smr/MutS family protein, partial [Clostridia bacterium]|nr:Smr/MutS family protein [Clostridia bacterium]
ERESLAEADLIKARTLKNRLSDKAYETEFEEEKIEYLPVKAETLKTGDKVFVKSLQQEGQVVGVRLQKGEAEVVCGNLRIRSKISDLTAVISEKKAHTKPNKGFKKNSNVQVNKSLAPKPVPTLELNVIGMTVQEALPDVAGFIDSAVISNLEEVRIVHGVGTGKLRAGIHDFLRSHKNVAEFRLGRYGEGEAGVTVVKIK